MTLNFELGTLNVFENARSVGTIETIGMFGTTLVHVLRRRSPISRPVK